jgi:hypothetical protein
MTHCPNCGAPTTLRAGMEWRHLDTNLRWCDPATWRTSTVAASLAPV